MTQTIELLIIGAGLSGLTTAYHLTRQDRRVTILEARQRVGGRIFTERLPNGEGGFDLGPAWFWTHQPHVQQMMQQFGVERFTQYETGDSLFERSPTVPVQRVTIPSEVVSYRFMGGTHSLIDGLLSRLPNDSIRLGEVVTSIEQTNSGVRVSGQTSTGARVVYEAAAVVVTLPPRLAVRTVRVSPDLPPQVAQAMHDTQTWMGQSMKAVLVYETPFWRAQGLSGMGVSYGGAVQQFHDAVTGDGRYAALFGWVGNHSFVRALPFAERRQTVIEQATRMFGTQAATPIYYADLNWQQEPYTTDPADDSIAEQEHPRYGHPLLQQPLLDGRLIWAGAEVSPVNGGYLDGAIYSGQRAAQQLLNIS